MKQLGKKSKTTHLDVMSSSELVQKTWKYMYHLPPTEELTLEVFENYAYDRLKLLKHLEVLKTKKMNISDMAREIQMEQKSLLGDINTQDKDYISHHILRLAFSKTETQRNWLKNQEALLFDLRLENDVSSLTTILEWNGIPVEKVTDTTTIYPEVKAAHDASFSKEIFDAKSDIWKVDWIHVLNLITSRKAFVSQGYAYITRHNLISVLSQNFRDKMGVVLERIYKVWPYLEEEEGDRLVPFLTKFGNKSVGNEYKVTTTVDGSITLENLDGLAHQSFPLCMKYLHSKLKHDHHLKHQARLQYGLFLKGIGMSLEMAMDFWKMEFTKKMSESDFTKNYSYNFRHQFGIEGKKTNYSPYGCVKILNGNAPIGEGAHHGCPYKHLEQTALRKELRDSWQSITNVQVEEVMDLVSNGHYQMACNKYFDISHTQIKHDPIIVHHPNQYFELSKKLTKMEIN